MEFLTTIGLLLFGWFATLSGVAVGGFLVYRATGRTGSLFSSPKGSAYNLADEFTDEAGQDVEPPDELKKFNERFQQTFNKGKDAEYDPAQEIFGTGVYGSEAAARPWTPPDIKEDEYGDIIEDEPAEGDGETKQ